MWRVFGLFNDEQNNETGTIESEKMTISWRIRAKTLIRSDFRKSGDGGSINEMDGGKNSLSLE